MALIVIGVSHRTAPLGVRERLALGPDETHGTLDRFRADAELRETVVISTCNRTELYAVEGERDATPAAVALLGGRLGGDAAPYVYVRRDREAAAHLFRVASGIDSMILGEAQVHGQVRQAWEAGRHHSGAVLNRLFQTALQVAGRVRQDTAIGRGAASVNSAAVQLAKKIFGSLHGRRAMVIGAGEMAELAIQTLVAEGVRAAVVANRTFERAEALASRYGAVAARFDECWAALPHIDVLLSSTAAPHPVVGLPQLGPVLTRRNRPLCILDIALPRDVEPAVRELDNVFLYDLDDLQAVVASSLDARRAELPTAEQVIAAEVERFWEWLGGLSALPVLTEVRAEMERLRERELAQALRRLGPLTPEQREAVEHLSRSLMNKFLHEPSVRLRAAAADGRGLAVVEAARYLFALDRGAPRVDAGDAADPVPAHGEER